MESLEASQVDVAIVGGGITGLAAALWLESNKPECSIAIFEGDDRLGGKIQTRREDGYVVEAGPDCFLTRKPRGMGLSRELGIDGLLVGRRPEHARTYVKRHGRLHRLPEGLTGLVPTNLDALTHSTLISPPGQERLARELSLAPEENPGDESVAAFVSRRMGREVYESLIEPLMSGIYAGDGEQLSLAATFPQLRTLEETHGSVIRGLTARTAGGAASQSDVPPFVAFDSGMEALVDEVAGRLTRTAVYTGRAVDGLAQTDGGYVLQVAGGEVRARAVIVTTPAFVTARLLHAIDPAAAQAHAAIPYASSATVSLAYARDQISAPLDGYGYVVPRAEETDILACTWTSQKWTNRAPDGHVLLRVYLGRYGRRDVTADGDDELSAQAQAELAATLGITAAPRQCWVFRWPRGMPQYTIGHVGRVSLIEERMTHHPGLAVAGAAYHGVGIPDCIAGGERAAKQIMKMV